MGERVDCLVLVCTDSNVADLRARIEAEVFGPLELTKQAVGPMKAQGRGSIVFVNATADPAVWGALYTGVQVLAKELGPANVRVNTVVPAADESPDKVADVVVFFASDLSAIVTGQSLVVSG
jgi:NAD(P)-dependent dehydrogenase (short-subunit alcohol dehydrogenase family)